MEQERPQFAILGRVWPLHARDDDGEWDRHGCRIVAFYDPRIACCLYAVEFAFLKQEERFSYVAHESMEAHSKRIEK